jgi:hypothetical protein
MSRHDPKQENVVVQQTARVPAGLKSTGARPTATKNKWLDTLILIWSGTEKATPLKESFENIEGTTKVGNWSEADKMYEAFLKLTGAAKTFHNSTL